MPKPLHVPWSLAALLVVVTVSIGVLVLRPENSAAASTSTTLPCSSSQLTSDYQIDNCLESKIHVTIVHMNTLLRKESVYFRYASKPRDWRVAEKTQATFMSYAREECLAQVNPYRTGTISPILYGECVLGFYNQRVTYLRDTIASFENGGESRTS